MRFCQSCGKEIIEGADVCVNCGKAVNGTKTTVQAGAGDKTKVAGGLLGIFLGTFGVHNFYLGYTGKAVAQLLITVLSCGFLAFVSSIWGLIEGIMILTGSINVDGKGNPIKD